MSTVLTSALPKTMQALRFYAPRDIRLEEVTLPVLAEGDMLIQIEVALTCGTDLKAYRRGHPVLLGELPAPFGHECVGRVVAIGDGVDPSWLAKRVVPANSAPCSECTYCLREQFTQCESLKLLNGAYAEYLKLPKAIAQKNTYLVSDDIPVLQVAFAEPLAVCLRGIEVSRIQPSDSVAIVGTGPIALILSQLAKKLGAHVAVLGRQMEKLEQTKLIGQADAIISLSEVLPEKSFDVVIDATGVPECWELALSLVRNAGLVNFFGGCPRGSTVTLSTERLHYDEVTVVSSFHHTPKHFKAAVEMLSSRQIDLRFLMTHEFPLAQIHDAFTLMDEGRASKIAIYPQSFGA